MNANRDSVLKVCAEYLRGIGAASLLGEKKVLSNGVQLLQLPGDASTRRYFRVWLEENQTSYVLMAMEPFVRATNSFLLVQQVLERSKVPVPKVLAEDGDAGLILLEDLGDKTMLHRLEAAMDVEVELQFFQSAIDLMLQIHSVQPVQEEKANVKGFSLAFDADILNWEVNFTFEHFLKNYLKRDIPAAELDDMKSAFGRITQTLASEPRVFTHRDFHTRNIMVPERSRLVSIDFQDARMGLRQYDLASLLRDSYYQLSEDKVYRLVDYYIEKASKQSGIINREHFIKIFDLMSIQRNWKAIGSFASFYVRRSNGMYLRFIGNTFENVRRNLAKFPEYRELHQNLFNWYYF